MKIALDYDQTFTNDEGLWISFVKNAKDRGHSVTFVTFRKENGNNQDILADAELLGIDIVFCNFKQKASQFIADIWIDDSPQYIPKAEVYKDHWHRYGVAEQIKKSFKSSNDL